MLISSISYCTQSGFSDILGREVGLLSIFSSPLIEGLSSTLYALKANANLLHEYSIPLDFTRILIGAVPSTSIFSSTKTSSLLVV